MEPQLLTTSCILFLLSTMGHCLQDSSTIKPVSCTNRSTGETGVCMFNWSCTHVAHGVNIGTCIDRFFIGSCCKLPQNGGASSKLMPTQWPPGRRQDSAKEQDSIASIATIFEILTGSANTRRNKLPFEFAFGSKKNKLFYTSNDDSDIKWQSTPNAPFYYKKRPNDDNPIVYTDVFSDDESTSTAIFDSHNEQKPVVSELSHNEWKPVVSESSHNERKQVVSESSHNERKPVVSESSHNEQKPVVSESSHNERKPVVSESSHNERKPVVSESSHNERRPIVVMASHDKRRPILSTAFHKPVSSFTYTPIVSVLFSNGKKPMSELGFESGGISQSPTFSYEIPKKPFHPPVYITSTSESFLTNNVQVNTDSSSVIILQDNDEDILNSADSEKKVAIIPTSISKWTELPYPWPSSKPFSASSNQSTPHSIKGESSVTIFSDFDSKVCGKSRNVPVGRIVGGQQARYLRWPWMISLSRYEDGSYSHRCGATLLNRLWAITAAHCVNGRRTNEILLRLGEYNFHTKNESYSHIDKRIVFMVIHPRFDPVSFENDLALLRFYDAVPKQENIAPVCLPSPQDDVVGKTAIVTGWGRLAEAGELPGHLHEVEMPVITNEECERLFSDEGYVETISDVFMCAGTEDGGIDACEGDSGGPMMIQGVQGQWKLVGLISWGMGCAAPRRPGVYTRISTFVNWIEKIIKPERL